MAANNNLQDEIKILQQAGANLESKTTAGYSTAAFQY